MKKENLKKNQLSVKHVHTLHNGFVLTGTCKISCSLLYKTGRLRDHRQFTKCCLANVARSARLLRLLFPPGCESPELKSPHPSLKPHTNPLPPETWTKLFCAIKSVLHTGEWACTNHL